MKLLKRFVQAGFRRFARHPTCAFNFGGRSHTSQGIADHQFDFRGSRLGLVPRWVGPYLESISKLSEVESLVDVLKGKRKVSSTVESDMVRACQILESMSRGGNEHMASLALRAELQMRIGKHKMAYQSMSDFEVLKEGGQAACASSIELSLAKAKAAWYMGDFVVAEKHCEDLLHGEDLHNIPLHYASSLTGYGLARMLQCEDLDCAFTVRDPCRMALKVLENYRDQGGTALIAAHLNMGVAEVVYADVVNKERGLAVSFDPALRIWSEGLTLLETCAPRSAIGKSIASALEIRLETNMAWGILMGDDMLGNTAHEATEHALNALACSDKVTIIDNNDKEYLRRSLTVLATCYHTAGNAVTAEGLLQSATSLPSIGCTLTKLDERNAVECFGELCRDCNKRESDAVQMRQRAEDLNKELPVPWQGKADVLSSLWFWTPGEYQY